MIIEIKEYILKHGESLSEAGVDGYGLTKESIISLMNSDLVEGTVVLGGDVYELNNGKPCLSFDNWYFDPTGSPSDSEESIAKALEYVTRYRKDGVLFSLTL